MWEYSDHQFRDKIDRLTFLINDTHHKEWFIQGLFPITKVPLMQQKIVTPGQALKQVKIIEYMVRYLSKSIFKPFGVNLEIS